MKRKVLLALTSLACVVSCALGFAACDLFGGGNNGDDNKKYVVYHMNGGYYGSDPDNTEDHRSTLYDNEIFKPTKAKKDTWLLENWYFDADLTEAYTEASFAELRAQKDEIDLYAKWIDEITVTKDNFTEYFKVSSRWNGGGTIGNAGISYSISPNFIFDPENSAQSVEVEVTPVLRNNNTVVWRGEAIAKELTFENDYSCGATIRLPSSAADIEFDIREKTLEYKLLTESFTMKLLHKVPVTITLDLGDGETDAYTATGSEKLLKSDLPTPEKKGYEFRGWYTDAEFKTEYEDWVVNRPRTLYAKFERKITVTYHMGGAAEKEAQTYFTSQNIYPGSDPEWEGYKFYGYYKSPDFEEETKFYSGEKSEVDLDLYARWEQIRTITFVTNDDWSKEPIKIADTEIPKASDLKYQNYKGSLEFYAWYTDAEFTHKFDETAPISGDVTLYALWVQRKTLGYSMDDLKNYVDIQITGGKVDGVLTLTITVTLKEEYRNYDFYLSGDWYVNLYNDSGSNVGNGKFVNANGMTILTREGDEVYTVTGVYTATPGTGNNDATKFEASFNNRYSYVCIPESDLVTE